MGLFSNNKKLCPVCGNPTPRLLATKIQDTPICKECDKKIYLPKGRTDRMTIDDFKQYIQFYEDNQALRDQFEENYSFNFGLFGGDLVLDIFHGLFRVNCDKDSLAFQADNLKSFRILEDSRVLFEGNHQELKHYDSKVPEKVKQLEPQIAQFQMQMNMKCLSGWSGCMRKMTKMITIIMSIIQDHLLTWLLGQIPSMWS